MEVTYTDSLNSFSRQGTTRTAEIHMCGFHPDIFAMEAKASQRVVEQLVRSHSLVSCWYSLGVVCQTPKTVNGCLDHLRGLALLWNTDQIQLMLHCSWDPFHRCSREPVTLSRNCKLLNWHGDFCHQYTPVYLHFAFNRCWKWFKICQEKKEMGRE